MSSKNFWFRVAGSIFGIVAIIHMIRIITGIPVLIGNSLLPLWINWLGMFVTGLLSFWLWKLSLNLVFGGREMMEINFIRRIRPENNPPPVEIPHEQLFEIRDWEDLENYNDRILLLPAKYPRLFGRTRRVEGYQYKKGIVKIFNPDNKRIIYRQFYGQNGFNNNEAGLTSLSLNELGITSGHTELKIEGTSILIGRIFYLWNHPNIIVRVPSKIAIISTLVGLLSIILGIVGIWLTNK